MDYAWYDSESRGRVYIVLSAFDFEIDGEIFTVPAGFESDGMSVPKYLWWAWNPKNHLDLLECSVVHDYLYASKVVSRRRADIWYRNQLEKHGYAVGSVLAFGALRFFGWTHWK